VPPSNRRVRSISRALADDRAELSQAEGSATR
jgi:hypothetical protein